MPSEEVAHIRRRTIRSLAAPYREGNHDGCSPQVCLSLVGLAVSVIGALFGMFFFSIQWRNYNVWLGGQLQWRCSLVVCSLRYASPSSLMERALDKLLQQQYASPEMEQWAIDFCNGRVEMFPTLWNLNFCKNQNLYRVQYKLFGAFCERSDYAGKFIDGEIWSIMIQTSRTAFIMASLSVIATLSTAVFLIKDHQVLSKTKKPRWAVSEATTGKFRPYVKICAGVSPLLLLLAAGQYRWCIGSFEHYGGIPKQTTLVGLMSRESPEVAVAWANVVFFAVSFLEGALAAALLAGPLRRPERPLGLDIFDTCLDVQLERHKTRQAVEMATKPVPANPGGTAAPGAPSVAAAPNAKSMPQQMAPKPKQPMQQSPQPYPQQYPQQYAPQQYSPQQYAPQPCAPQQYAQQQYAQPYPPLAHPLQYPPLYPQGGPPMQPMLHSPRQPPAGQGPAGPKSPFPDRPPGVVPPRSPRAYDGFYQAPVPPNWSGTTKFTSS